MSYTLGVDLGTTYTAAAVWRAGRTDVLELGLRTSTVPSVVLLREDETVLTGEAATRRALNQPDRVAREFKRRVGDTTPLLLGGTPMSAEALMARLLGWVVATVTEREGGPPDRVAVTHPANWGPYKTDLLRQSVRLAGLDGALLLTEPEAAAIHYASLARVEIGATVAVYDLGGGTFDAAVLRKVEQGWEVLGEPEGVERLGGIDLDAAVFGHVQRALGDRLSDLDPDDPQVVAALTKLREECVEAKEALSVDQDVSINVMLPNLQTEVVLTRDEFERMIRPALADSIEALRRALSSAGVAAAELSAVLLVGGSSRIPLVSELVAAELGRPVAVDVHPKHAVAQGAALAAASQIAPPAPAVPTAPPVPAVPVMAVDAPTGPDDTIVTPPAAPMIPPSAPVTAQPSPRSEMATSALAGDGPRAGAGDGPSGGPGDGVGDVVVVHAGAGAAPMTVDLTAVAGDGGGGSATGGRRRILLVVLGCIAALVVVGGVLGGGKDRGRDRDRDRDVAAPASTEPQESTEPVASTVASDSAGTLPDGSIDAPAPGDVTPDTGVNGIADDCDRNLQACIIAMEWDGEDLVVSFETNKTLTLDPDESGDLPEGTYHIHWFFSPVDATAENAGVQVPRNERGNYQEWAAMGETGDGVFASSYANGDDGEDGFTADMVGDNTELCSVIAGTDHRAIVDSAYCVSLLDL